MISLINSFPENPNVFGMTCGLPRSNNKKLKANEDRWEIAKQERGHDLEKEQKMLV